MCDCVCANVCVCESVWKNKYLKLKYLHTLEHCLHNNTERQGQKKELAQSERQQNGVAARTRCAGTCVEKKGK